MMKKRVYIVILFLFSYNNLFGYCAYQDCQPSISPNVYILLEKIDNKFNDINNKIEKINSDNQVYSDKLKMLNKNYEKNKALKKEYLIVLKNIAFELEKIKKIKAVPK